MKPLIIEGRERSVCQTQQFQDLERILSSSFHVRQTITCSFAAGPVVSLQRPSLHMWQEHSFLLKLLGIAGQSVRCSLC